MSRPLVGPRLQRVLALVPWILAHPGVTIAELAARFEVSERELERDLELLPMCGLPPYTADRLIDVSVIDGGVEIRLAEYFERPLRLTPAEGLALLAAGRALLAVPGSDADGPLATALAKLDDALGAPGSARGRRRHQRPARAAPERGSRRRARRDRLLLVRARRDDDPRHRSVARVPRVRRLVRRPRGATAPTPSACSASTASARCAATGEHFDPASRADDDTRDLVYRPRPDDPRVTLRLGPGAEWVVESHPHESAKQAKDGSWQVVLAISEPAWLERLLVGLGPGSDGRRPARAARARRGRRGAAPPPIPGHLRSLSWHSRGRPRPFRVRWICEDGAVEQPR